MLPEAREYVDGVLGGSIPSGALLRRACERSIRDLESPPRGYRWSESAARRVLDWTRMMRMTTGDHQGRPFSPAPWQIWLISEIYGWVDERGRRRYRYAYVEVPRKNGKTEFLAALGLYHLCADGERAAEVVCAASTLDQARILYTRCARMLAQDADLAAAYELRGRGSPRAGGEIQEQRTDGTLKPLSSDRGGSQDGRSISMAMVDELHAHPDRSMWAALESSTGARSNPLIVAITTAGVDTAGVCWEQRQLVVDLLGGAIENPRYFGAVWTVDDGVEWDDEAGWAAANPNLGVSVDIEMLRAAAATAKGSPAARRNFQTKHLDMWLSGHSAWLDMARWRAAAQRVDDEDMAAAEDVWLGLDLSSGRDLTAVAILFRSGGVWRAAWRLYLPELAVEDSPLRETLSAWGIAGRLIVTEGGRTDFQRLETDILDLLAALPVRGCGYDPWQSGPLISALERQRPDIDWVRVPQGAQSLSPPAKSMEAELLAMTFRPDDCPVAEWCAGNAVAREDARGNILPQKQKNAPERRIDAISALLAAWRVAENTEPLAPLIQRL